MHTLNRGLKIGCWNIQSIRYKDNDKTYKNLFLMEIRKHDIVVLTETHTVEGENIPIADYYTYCLHRQKHAKAWKGVGGIAITIHNSIRRNIKILTPKSKDYVWVQLDKNAFSLDNDLFICAAYIPPQDSSYSKQLKTDIFDDIESDVYKYKNKGHIILTGDLNAITGTAADSITEDNDKHLPTEADYVMDTEVISRQSQDHIID